MTTEAWILIALVVLVVLRLRSISADLREVARSVENIDDRLKHVHPIGPHERAEAAEDDEFLES